MSDSDESTPKRVRFRPEVAPGVSHPAVFSKSILERLPSLFDDSHKLVLDPFAGTGKIHELSNKMESSKLTTFGVEIEPEWARLNHRTAVANAIALPFRDESFDAVVTSPTYGNRFADKHNAKDGSIRRSYTHDLGRTLHAENSGSMQWGQAYRDLHVKAWAECFRVVRPGGLFVLNISDHVRAKRRQFVSSWHLQISLDLGFRLIRCETITTNRLREGANSSSRIDGEFLFVMVKP